MLKPDQVPEAVWHTAMSTYHKAIRKRPGTAWQEAIVAAINAWPGGAVCHYTIADIEGWEMVLPLPTEADAEKFEPYTCTRCLGSTANADDLCDNCAKEVDHD